MPISTPSFQPSDVVIVGSTSCLITNKTLLIDNTEYSHSLQTEVKQLIIKTQSSNMAKLQFSFVINESSTNFITIWPGSVFHVCDLSFTSKTLYIQSNKSSTIIEIVEFY